MGRIKISAPGKLVLFGEYAVLFGAPAAVAAIDRRAVVTLRPFAGNGWELAAPGLVAQRARLEVEPDNTVRWHDEKLGRDAFGLIDTLLRGIGESGSIDLVKLPPLAATLDTRAFFESAGGWESKLGLGSSAALTVALISALAGWGGLRDRRCGKPSWGRHPVPAYRRWVGGRGGPSCPAGEPADGLRVDRAGRQYWRFPGATQGPPGGDATGSASSDR
jgi:phosphomevalonate kinase